ncbi:hypothetical protein [Nonomuraea sp. NPDC049758]|uniref:hypothetical protein n=1 Tax=Nonomuraea sp. NPDC049758 TaxID=3154360 RepID=UPI0034274EE1
MVGKQCNKDNSICTFSLNNADTWLIAGMLLAVGGAAGVCALSTAATVIGLPLSAICTVAGVIAGLAGGALGYLNRNNHGIWIKVTVTPPYVYRGVPHQGDPVVTWGSQ